MFSLPVGTEMFHFPTFPPNALYIQAPVTGLSSSWVSPFGHPRITARLPTPRGLSQAPTSFIGSWCQGIHHLLLIACRHKDARVHCEVLNIRPAPPPHPAPTNTQPAVHRRRRPDKQPNTHHHLQQHSQRQRHMVDPSGPNSVFLNQPHPPATRSTPTPHHHP